MSSETVELGMPAPDFTLESSVGRPVSLSDYYGRPLALYFIREFA